MGKIEEARGTGRNVKQGWTEMKKLPCQRDFFILVEPQAAKQRNQGDT